MLKALTLALAFCTPILFAASGARAETFGSAAAGIYETTAYNYVAIGLSTRTNQQNADDVALDQCSARNVPRSKCRIIRRWSEGCYHMVTGVGVGDDERVGWGGAFSKGAALEACREHGIECLAEKVESLCIKK